MLKITTQQAKNVFKKSTLPKYLREKGISIVMPEKDAKAWLKALRSGEYSQVEGALHNANTGGFCCLGVQQHCKLKGYVEIADTVDAFGDTEFAEFPSKEYLRKNGIFYADESGRKSTNPYLMEAGETAADMNDYGHTFTEIADDLEVSIAVY